MGELCPTELSWPLWMRIRLPRHDLLREKKLANLSEEKSPEYLFPWALACIGIHIKERRYGLQITFLGPEGPVESESGRQE